MPASVLARKCQELFSRAFHRPGEYQRHCRLYGIGTPKSGTHSVARMFVPPIRSAHEIEYHRLADKIMQARSGRISQERLRAWLRRRDCRINLDVDSSTLNFFILDTLRQEFPDARFLLTIRDCYSWLNSMTNHVLRYPQKKWKKFRDFRFRPDLFRHAPGERAFQEKGLHSVEGYLAYWANHNREALDRIPEAHLLVVRTEQISDKARDIAAFAGLADDCIDAAHTAEFQNPDRNNLLRQIDRSYLETMVEKHCRGLMRRFFPEIVSLEDARL